MKRRAYIWAGAAIATLLLISPGFAQSDDVNLGAAARAQRKDKPSAPKTVYDNDNLPKEEHISVVGQSPSTPAAADGAQTSQDSQAKPDSQANPDDEKAKLAITPDQSPADREQAFADWRKKFADQKDTISLLQRELDVLQREYRLRAAVMYADAGNRLRNQSDWDKEDHDYKDKIAAKQKDLDRAKQQLNDLQDDARKAGVPAGMIQ